ncbi:hypothetical protein TVAG_498540 [Trichomonas vaginalis G3]|uniref:Importin N-terminal domain-containing protein n=1 Tax=Trichomonas vaginalis (strain ATCC PRA-98 / G3) TaxID=412133 RepID=A2E842_TRIV3|nr:armadillo (ARM) repeat-containing protein family [Trichomonas vaginalis G3]EAY11160.1 hypothetical protein TVAG_498540 [Trichomonas vaginalis G3]KAI5500101.1 armadillo (ARM) repeat-containing protein family [Trichomonas vaginalis G3]|eukprot:XP_001323383.1 hypothetical protein [Trichomonas vaginalis G3]
MEIQDFRNISSQDPEIVKATGEKLMELCQNPEFLHFLVQTLHKEEVLSDKNLLRNVLIAFKRFAAVNWKALFDALSDDSSKETIISLLFMLPPDQRSTIQDCFVQAAINKEEEFLPVFEAIFGLINDKTPLADIYTVLSMCAQFITAPAAISFGVQISESLNSLIEAAGELVGSDENAFLIIAATANIQKVLVQRKSLSIDQSFMKSLEIYIQGLKLEGSNANQTKMKESILDFFVYLIQFVYEGTTDSDEKEIDINKAELVQLFNNDVMPALFEGVIATTHSLQSTKMIDGIISIIYYLVYFNLFIDDLVTEEIFNNFIIPAAKLTTEDYNDFNVNPSVYISQCFTDDSDLEMTARIAASKFTYHVTENYLAHFDPIEILSNIEIPESKAELSFYFDLESRIYLMCSYAKIAPIDAELFEKIFNILTIEIEPFVTATILRFISIVQPKEDIIIASITAGQVLQTADNIIVAHAAVNLLNEVFNEVGKDLDAYKEFIDAPFEELFPKVTELLDELKLPVETTVLSKLFRIGGTKAHEESVNIINGLVDHWCKLAEENNDANELTMEEDIDAIASTIDCIPVETNIQFHIQEDLLNKLKEDITQYPQSAGISQHVKVAAVLAIKLCVVTPSLADFVMTLLAQMNNSFINIDIDEYFAMLISSILLNKETNLTTNNDFVTSLGQKLQGILSPIEKREENEQEEYNSASNIVPALFIAACGCYAGIDSFYQFIDNALNILHFGMTNNGFDNEEMKLLTWASFYLFTGSLINNESMAIQKLMNDDVVEMLCKLYKSHFRDVCYRDLKCGFITLTYLAKNNAKNAFDVAGSLSSELFDRMRDDTEWMQNNVDKGIKDLQINEIIQHYNDLQLQAIIPAIKFPVSENEFNEFAFYQSVSNAQPL